MAHNCDNCGFRAKYEKNPTSLLGRIWRWHAGWCPGWRKYMNALPEQKRIDIAVKYKMEKFK